MHWIDEGPLRLGVGDDDLHRHQPAGLADSLQFFHPLDDVIEVLQNVVYISSIEGSATEGVGE